MGNPQIHFLNVKYGDCFIVESRSGRVTMIDICCGNLGVEEIIESKTVSLSKGKPKGNFRMCENPTNPIKYLAEKNISEVWRFILTHPDMDHMDGIEKLFKNINVKNYWDNKIRKVKPDFNKNSLYKEHDWEFYEAIINNEKDVKVISPIAGGEGKYWNMDDDDGNGDGDFISIVSPTEELVNTANKTGKVNDASYVIVYRSSAGNIIFPGDSNDKTWEYILENHASLVQNAAVLFAPHHGRKSGRDYSFLDIVNPRISFFGCASSSDLAYSSWQNRKLDFFTNNQCGNIHLYPEGNSILIFIENEKYAKNIIPKSTYQRDDYWFLCEV